MRSKRTLIRLHKWKVDQERRKLSLLQAQRHALEEKKAELEQTALDEQAKAAESDHGALLYPSFAQSVILRRAELDESIDGVSGKIHRALDATKSAFLELKKYEIVEENRVASEKLESRRSEQRDQDEVASSRFARQKKNPAL